MIVYVHLESESDGWHRMLGLSDACILVYGGYVYLNGIWARVSSGGEGIDVTRATQCGLALSA